MEILLKSKVMATEREYDDFWLEKFKIWNWKSMVFQYDTACHKIRK